MFLPLRFNKILSLFLLSSCSFNVMAFSDVDKGGQIRATGFQSELSGILTTRLMLPLLLLSLKRILRRQQILS